MARSGGTKQQTIELERERLGRRYDLAKWTFPPVLWIASLWIPLQGAVPIAKELSGQQTSLTVSISITLIVSLAASAALIASFLKARESKRENERLREVIQKLEGQKG